jgi:phosphoserine phosphatase RsbU/P
VVHVGTLGDRRFTDEDTRLLEVVAERVALTLQSGQLKVERAAAHLLERSLLPDALPDVPGIEMAARYVPAEDRDVGGDWYDAFRMPSGAVWVTAGDVAGHGLRAAVVMGRLRTAIRAYVLEGASPGEVIALTDRNLQYFEPGEMATAICVRYEPGCDHLVVASAGHPPPVVVHPGHDARIVERRPEPPLGVVAGVERRTTQVPFPPGSVLVLYTDGLIERRREALTVGLERLRRVVSPIHPDVLCRQVMLRLVGDTVPRDDIALIALRRTGIETGTATGAS